MRKFGPSVVYIVPSVVIGLISLFLGVFLLLKSKVAGIAFFALVFLPLSFILLYLNYRSLFVDDSQLCLKTVLGKKCVSWDKVRSVRVEKLGMRNVLWIDGEDVTLITPLIFSDLKGLKDFLVEKVGEKVSSEGWQRSLIDLLMLYFAMFFLLFVVLIKII
ncbi:MAG: hypothetical protein GXO44_01995 [Deferribacteres bacterium]|nr:hypothetical protein [Deferribacteres bacterium]